MPKLSIRLKLFLSFLVVVLVGVASVSFLSQRTTNAEFRSYMTAGGAMYVRNAATALGDWYGETRSWTTVGPAVASLARTPDDHLVLTVGSAVIADSTGQWTGRLVNGLPLTGGVPITSDGVEVGRLYLVGTDAGVDPTGMMRGMGQQGRGRGPRWLAGSTDSAGDAPSTPEDIFLAAVNQSLWQAALLAVGGAALMSLLLTRQITGPLRALAEGAVKVAAGDLAQRIPVRSSDEIGTVTRTFNEMTDSLQRQEQARRNLLADVAHELRTPLTVIEGTADAILDGVYEPTPEVIKSMRDEARTLAKVVTDLRTISLADAGQLRLDLEPTSALDLARRAVQSAGASAAEKGIDLKLAAEAADVDCLADPERIAQVLGNLLSNAIRHTPTGGGISVSVQPTSDREVTFSVADSGEGISAEDLPHVFDRFFRADRSRTRSSGGSGLGLSIAKQIVEQHGGHIRVESMPGRGSTFACTLPIAGKSSAGSRAGSSS